MGLRFVEGAWPAEWTALTLGPAAVMHQKDLLPTLPAAMFWPEILRWTGHRPAPASQAAPRPLAPPFSGPPPSPSSSSAAVPKAKGSGAGAASGGGSSPLGYIELYDTECPGARTPRQSDLDRIIHLINHGAAQNEIFHYSQAQRCWAAALQMLTSPQLDGSVSTEQVVAFLDVAKENILAVRSQQLQPYSSSPHKVAAFADRTLRISSTTRLQPPLDLLKQWEAEVAAGKENVKGAALAGGLGAKAK